MIFEIFHLHFSVESLMMDEMPYIMSRKKWHLVIFADI